jgi:hypothetical protein
MKAASLNEVKKELAELDVKSLREICMRVAKYKVENKELLTYLLFEAHDESNYVSTVKEEMDTLFHTLPSGNVYYIKKGLRRILRILNKQIRYSGNKQSEVELRIYFCMKMKEAEVPFRSSTVLYNLKEQQLKKINSVLNQLPEDLQFDYQKDIATISKA